METIPMKKFQLVLPESISSTKTSAAFSSDTGRSLDHDSRRSGTIEKVSRPSSIEDDDISEVTWSTLGRSSISDSCALTRNSTTTSQSKRSWKTTSLAPSLRKRNQVDLTIDKLNFTSLGIYGRDEELKLLKLCFDQASSGAVDRQLVLISGYSGTGKTALSDSLKEHADKVKGLYVRGKFDSNSRCKPYSAITTSCIAICGCILSLQKCNPVAFEGVCKSIKEDLGSELSLLIQFVPAIKELTGLNFETQAQKDVSSEEAKNRFNFAFQRFIRIISKEFSPLIFVLDDLQWADPSSLDLIDALLSDQKASELMILGIYRSNEVDDTHIFYRTLEGFRLKNSEGIFQMTEITVGNLDVVAVGSVLTDLLSMDQSERMMNLAEICHKKTHGNVFFLLHFLAMLHDRKFLQFNLGLMGWSWDLEGIKADTSISDNVVDLLREKMVELSPTVVSILKVAACLGFIFEEHTVKLALENMSVELPIGGNCEEVLREGLAKLEDDGYIHIISASPLTTHNRSFSWTHDKIHESAATLIDSEHEWVTFSHHIGRILATQMSKNELDSSIFVVVNLLNKAALAMTDDGTADKERLQVATLNYQAAKKAVLLSAFESAASYANHGIELLPQNHWVDHYDLSIGLYSIGAQVTGCLGYIEVMERYCNEVISKDFIPLEGKFVVYHARIEQLKNQGRPAEASEVTLDILKKLGCKFPKKPILVVLSIIGNIIKLKGMAKTLNIDNLPGMMDQKRFEILKLIDKLSTCWYMVDDNRLPLASFRILNWTMKYGYSDYSSVAFASSAMILTGILDDLPGGAAFGKLAAKLTEKSPGNLTHARTIFMLNAFVFPWTVPLTQLQKQLLRAYDAGLQCGDPEASIWSILVWMLSRLVVGSPLEQLESDCLLYSRQMKDLKRIQQLYITKYIRQVALNLMGQNDGSLLELIGKSFSEEELAHCKQDKFHIPGLIMYQGILHTYFGDHVSQADAAIYNGHDYLQKGYLCSLTIPYDHYLKGVSCYIAAGLTKQKKYVKMAKKLRLKIKRWREMGNPNVNHYEFLMDAEYAVLMGKHFEANRNYEAAILFAARSGFLHDAAFSSERFGDFQLNVMNNPGEAKYRIEQSINYWRDYGAMGKIKDLEMKYVSVLSSIKTGESM